MKKSDMKNSKNKKSPLDALRNKINSADATIIAALGKRQSCMPAIGKYKKANGMALTQKGDTLFSLGSENPDNYKQAIAAWKILSADPAAPSSWSNQALEKMGEAYEKLGDTSAALNCYYGVFSHGQKGEPEYFWYYKAGFAAGKLLEAQKLLNEAIAVYEKIGSLDGPRAEEARNRVNTLRLENFLWEN